MKHETAVGGNSFTETRLLKVINSLHTLILCILVSSIPIHPNQKTLPSRQVAIPSVYELRRNRTLSDYKHPAFSRNTGGSDNSIQSRRLRLYTGSALWSTPHQPQLIVDLIIRPDGIGVDLQEIDVGSSCRIIQNCCAIDQELDSTPKDTLKLLGVGVASAVTRIREDAVRVRQILHGSDCDGVRQVIIFRVSSRPGEFRQAGEKNALIIREDVAAVILTRGDVETIVDYIIGIDEAGADKPFVSFECFVEVVSARWSVWAAIGEFGGCGKIQLVFYCTDLCVCFVPPVEKLVLEI